MAWRGVRNPFESFASLRAQGQFWASRSFSVLLQGFGGIRGYAGRGVKRVFCIQALEVVGVASSSALAKSEQEPARGFRLHGLISGLRLRVSRSRFSWTPGFRKSSCTTKLKLLWLSPTFLAILQNAAKRPLLLLLLLRPRTPTILSHWRGLQSQHACPSAAKTTPFKMYLTCMGPQDLPREPAGLNPKHPRRP